MKYVAASDALRSPSPSQRSADFKPHRRKILRLASRWLSGGTEARRIILEARGYTLGEPQNFLYFPDGTAHKNRMQGNDFVQSVM